MNAMDYHSGIKLIQYACTAILGNLLILNKGILNEESVTCLGLGKQQNAIKILIEVMNEHQSDPVLLKNGLSILKLFDFTKIEMVNKKCFSEKRLSLV